MAPTEKVNLPLRWELIPVATTAGGTILWRWAAFTQDGTLAMQSKEEFDSYTACFNDARQNGYPG
ncbi:MAG TPA: hypothetical protein VI321_04230 [Burkholderiales bacterium]